MTRKSFWFSISCLLLPVFLVTTPLAAEGRVPGSRPGGPIPDDFPRFIVPGHEREMALLRELFWLHYQSAGPLIPLWDEWLPMSTLWPARGEGEQLQGMRNRWAAALASRGMTDEGYVHSQQHGGPEFDADRRVAFSPATASSQMDLSQVETRIMIPVYRRPGWKGTITGLRIGFGNTGPGRVVIKSFHTASDTRHNVNNPNFIRGCHDYFAWSGDVGFLRDQIGRVRSACRRSSPGSTRCRRPADTAGIIAILRAARCKEATSPAVSALTKSSSSRSWCPR